MHAPLTTVPNGGSAVSTDADYLRLRVASLERDLQRLAYAASHDLGAPLRTIESFAQLVAQRHTGALGEKTDRHLHFIVDGAQRMRAMLDALLTYSRTDSQAARLAPVAADECVARARATLGRAIASCGADLTVGALPTVNADAAQLTEVFVQLVGNALKFRRPDRPPTVRVWAEPHDATHVVLHVSDDGIGIDADAHDRVFEVFRTLHPPDDFPGVGIGLAIVKRIVERHGGRVWVASPSGGATTFSFTLKKEAN